MNITNQKLYAQAHGILARLYGPDAAFREGQYEAIEAAMTKHRTLVVQKTGWGKIILQSDNKNEGRKSVLFVLHIAVLFLIPLR